MQVGRQMNQTPSWLWGNLSWSWECSLGCRVRGLPTSDCNTGEPRKKLPPHHLSDFIPSHCPPCSFCGLAALSHTLSCSRTFVLTFILPGPLVPVVCMVLFLVRFRLCQMPPSERGFPRLLLPITLPSPASWLVGWF